MKNILFMAIFLLATLTAGLSMMTSMVQSANADRPPTAGCHDSTGSNGCGGGGYGIFSNSGGFACIVKTDTCHGKYYK